MNIASRPGQTAWLEKLGARLEPREDFDLWFWSAMNAAINADNAALHHAAVVHAWSFFHAPLSMRSD